MIGNRFITIHGADPVKWAARFGIEPFSAECPDCNAERTTTLPIAQGTLRGLMAPPCPCGAKSRTYCVVRDPRFGDLFTGSDK